MRRSARWLLVAGAAGVVVAGCGDDDQATPATETTESTETTEATATTGATAVPAAFCQARVDLEVALEEEDAAAAAAGLDALDANAPASIAEQVSTMTDRLREDPEGALEAPEVIEAKAAIDAAVMD